MNSKRSMIEGSIWKSIVFFSIPIILESLFQQLYNTVDAILVGRFIGKEALSAVGSSTSVIISLLIGFFTGLATGVTVNVSQLFGSNNIDDMHKTMGTGITISAFCGIVISVIGIIFSKNVLVMMNTPPEILDTAVTYIRIYFIGLSPTLLYNTCAGILRATGDSKKPLFFLVISSMLNITLDLLFIIILKLGVSGVAIATVVSQIIGCCLIFIYLKKRFDFSFGIRKDLLKKILGIGLPAGLQSIMFSVTNIISQVNMNKFGTDYVTGWTVYTKIGIFFFTLITSYGIALMTFVGQNYGAHKIDRIHKGVKQSLIISFCTTLLINIVYLQLKEPLIRIFTNDRAVIEAGINILKCIVPLYFTYVCMEVLVGALKGMGESFMPLCITGFGVCFLRVLWLIIVVPQSQKFETIILSLPLGWAVTSVMIIVYYLYYCKRKLKTEVIK